MDKETLEKLESLEARIATLEKQIEYQRERMSNIMKAVDAVVEVTGNSITGLRTAVDTTYERTDKIYKTVKGY